MPTSVIADKRLSHAEFRVLVALLSFADKEHKAWPSLRLLSERSGIGKSNVSRNLKRLSDLGFVQRSGGIYVLKFSESEAGNCEANPVSAVVATTSTVVAATTSDVVTATRSKQTKNKPITDQTPPKPPKTKTQLTLVSEPDEQHRDVVAVVVSAWNAMAEVNGLPKAQKLHAQRKASIKRRVKEDTLPALLHAIRTVGESDFLAGRETRWKADFDWILKPANFTKIMEGKYANRTQPNPCHGQQGQTLGDIQEQYRSFMGPSGPA